MRGSTQGAHPLRGGSVPPGGQSEAGGTGAHCAPLRGGSQSPPCCNGRWVAVVWRDNAFTRVARPEGKRGDSQEGRNRRCLPSCAQCGRAGRVPARWERAQTLLLSRRYRRRTSPVQSLTMTSPSAPDGAATSPQRGGRLGSAGDIGRSRARAGFFAAGCASAQNDRRAEAGWVVQTASVITRKRGILRCAQDDKKGAVPHA